jgi:hypothetical protein
VQHAARAGPFACGAQEGGTQDERRFEAHARGLRQRHQIGLPKRRRLGQQRGVVDQAHAVETRRLERAQPGQQALGHRQRIGQIDRPLLEPGRCGRRLARQAEHAVARQADQVFGDGAAHAA